MKIIGGLCVASVLGCAAQGQTAEPASDLAAAFGARPAISQVALAPDGHAVSFVAPLKGQGSALFVLALQDGAEPRRVAVASGAPERLNECHWARNDTLICEVYGSFPHKDMMAPGGAWPVPFQNLDIVPANGPAKPQDDKSTPLSFGPGGVLDWIGDGASRVIVQTVSMAGRNAQLDWFDSKTGKRDKIESGGAVEEFIGDGRGRVRIARFSYSHFSGDVFGTNFRYRDADGGDWKPLSDYDPVAGAGFLPVAVDPLTNLAWGFRKVDGRWAVFTKTLDGKGVESLVAKRSDVDIDTVVRIGRSQRIVGVSYVTEQRHFLYTDLALDRLAAGLAKALPALPIIQIVDASDDETRLVIRASADNDPGRYYVLDRRTNHLQILMPVRPQLDGVPLAKVKPISFAASDGTMIPAYLTVPPGGERGLPAIVMPHGGPSARDEGDFDWIAQYYASRGFAVLQPNFRGSTGYGDQFLPEGGFNQWKTAIGDISSGAKWMIQSGVADPKRIAIFGWSYGGYAALQSVGTDPALFKAAVAVAPVTDLNLLKGPARFFPDWRQFNKFVGPEAGGIASPVNNAARIAAPVLLVHGTFDLNVAYDHSKRMADRLNGAGKRATLITFVGLDHQLDDGDARAKVLRESEEFIRASISGK